MSRAKHDDSLLASGELIDGQLRWVLEPHRRGSISTVGRLDRQALLARQINLALPEELIDQIAQMTEGGGTQASYLALLVFAVETLKKQKLQFRLEVCHAEVCHE